MFCNDSPVVDVLVVIVLDVAVAICFLYNTHVDR